MSSPATPRNIVVCLDGTNDKYDTTLTNVVRLFALLDKYDTSQLAYYQTGIGTLVPAGVLDRVSRWLFTRLDLAIAWLLREHVTAAYRFLMRYYEPGDRIFIFGFSRGAYSARVLAGMLFKVGLLERGNEELIPFAWDIFRKGQNFDLARGFRHTFSRKVQIHFLGLWDTVSSVGWAWNPKSFEYTANNPGVATIRHAVSLDERRTYFVQNLWGPDSDDCQQVWFPGVHCDVGGGYQEVESGLALLSLEWMVEQAEAAGLRLHPTARKRILGGDRDARVIAPQHESLRGLWWVLEWLPKPIRNPAREFRTRWILPRGRHRFVGSGALIHRSVLERRERLASYRPTNLPGSFEEAP